MFYRVLAIIHLRGQLYQIRASTPLWRPSSDTAHLCFAVVVQRLLLPKRYASRRTFRARQCQRTPAILVFDRQLARTRMQPVALRRQGKEMATEETDLSRGKPQDSGHQDQDRRTVANEIRKNTLLPPMWRVSGDAASASAEDVRRAEVAFLRQMVEGAADVTTLIAPDGTILYASASISRPASLGYTPEEVVGRNCLDIVHPEDRELVTRAIANDLAGVPTTIEVRVRRRDETWFWVEMRGKAIVAPAGPRPSVSCR
jgi:PAS domain S-box-containing protein